ncbi:unnamed protein product [Clonostachys rosea]|uniref:Major facilitator superfamily (MFS) profile domain-containing protein n=1 Tax=Bionectria ochroleuca TaxID=29856 RepID=A0ABY6ULE7_BIOOC|nr:unnamed protein product [Clonostachys rosea]
MGDGDPLNWPKVKKVANLLVVAFHAMMATFTAAAIQSAFSDIAEEFEITVQKASYLTSLVVMVLGGAPFFWRPLSHVYGRRPIFLITLLCSLIGNIGCAVSPSYATMGLCRAITAFFISPASSLGSAIVSETFFRNEQAHYMGIWTAMVTLGVPVAPLIFGFVAMRVGYRWIYWILALTNAAQIILHILLCPETRYNPNEVGPKTSFRRQFFQFRRLDPTPLKIKDFLHPLSLATRPSVMIPAVSYSMIFLWGSVMTTFEIPQLFPEKFGFNTQQVGLQYIGIILGTVIGEQIGGLMSDKWMAIRKRRSGVAPPPEYRLWLSYPGHILTITGVIVFLVQLDRAGDRWNITPIVGAAIAAAGNQIVTTVSITYAVDCFRHDSASVGVFITFVRQLWGFIGPFWIPQMIENLGLQGSTGITTATMVAVSILPMILLQWRGKHWRGRLSNDDS